METNNNINTKIPDVNHNNNVTDIHTHVCSQHTNETITIDDNLFDNLKKSCIQHITAQLDKYKNNEFALNKLHRYCSEIIPNSIETSVKNNTTREEKMNKLRDKSETFITTFLDSYPQYYYFQNSTFVTYDGEKYSISNEDNISNRLVMLLSMDVELASRKHKLKTTVIKRIRDRGTNIAVPSSNTIQNILKPLYPSVFETRNETKYFLTVIGDVINKKTGDLTYFVHYRAKEFIDFIISGLTFLRPNLATSLSNVFKYKFQNHNFTNSRIIRIQGTSGLSLYYPNINIIDLYFVAQYYSNRFGSAEALLQLLNFSNISNHSMILAKYGNETKIVEWFINETLIPSSNPVVSTNETNQTNHTNNTNEEGIDTKTIQYMWKRFCQTKKIPNVIQNSALIPIILTFDKLSQSFDKDKKIFKGYIGNQLYNPSINLFMEFWNDTITFIPSTNTISETSHTNIFDDDFKQLEIDELSTLFNSWLRKRTNHNSRYAINTVNNSQILEEEEIISFIKHFYPDIDIEDDKYVNGITCSLWDKQKEVFEFIETNNDDELNEVSTPKTVDTLYRNYCQKMLRTKLCIASKGYFEKAYNHFS